jgi:dTDP-4-dehydrorhamnose reductase
MRIVVTGANGQLGQAVMRQFDGHHELYPLGHADIELSEARTADIINANKLTDPSLIFVGQVLFIPGGK